MTASSRHRRRALRESGSALVVVLWCMAILGVMAYSMLHTSRLGLRIARNHGDAVQARYLALAGIEKAKAFIYQQSQELANLGTVYSTNLLDHPDGFEDVELGRGLYRVIRQGRHDEGRGVRYGISEEDALLDVNVASLAELKKLPEMTPMAAAGIVDWRDEDAKVTAGGAEQETYDRLSPPYKVKNAPIRSHRELLMVRGVDPQLLLGEDMNANGLLDAEENDGGTSFPRDNRDGYLDSGWLQYMTLEAGTRNVNARGEARVDLKSASAEELSTIDGISDEIAQAIVGQRGNLNSIVDLLEVTRPQPNNNPQNPGNAANPQNSSNPAGQGNAPPGGNPPTGNTSNAGSGEKLISASLLKDIAGEVSVTGERILVGRVNVNACQREILMCLPGLTEELASAIIDHRAATGFFANLAQLLDVPGMTTAILKQVYPRLTVRSDTFRIVSEGEVPSTGARLRVMTIVRYDGFEFETLYHREDL